MTGNRFSVVALMALGFGLVGIDRFMISTLYPSIASELQLDYGDIGTITGALAIAWGIAALFMGNLSDRIGRRKVLTGSLLMFSLLIGASGLASGLLSLVMVRVLMGAADGAFTPPSIAATLEASAPGSRGLNIGIQQTMLPLFGLGIAPLLVSQLLHLIDWRVVFSVFVIPGLLLTWAVWRTLPDDTPARPNRRAASATFADFTTVIGYRNIRIGMAMMLCCLTCLITTSALMPSLLTDHHKLPFSSMGIVMSAIGIGSMAGTLALPWLSDYIGRKPVMIVAAAGATIGLLGLGYQDADATKLFWWLFTVHAFNNALITLTVGPLCSETVSPSLSATASGVVIATGELFGGGIAPMAGGYVADRFGIDAILWLPTIIMSFAIVLTFALQEAGPRAAPAAGSGRI